MPDVKKHVLSNGLTILVYPVHTIPKVAIQLWYNVGSKDEKDGQRGLAHLLEHMIFKGTEVLSESDINLISHKLSGNCNAFTGHDYTGYLFDFPKQNWYTALPLLADCMRNCTFKEDLLNSELKAVIQELKMYKDEYRASLCEEMISAIFAEHPYHYPIIGYKQDLWSITRDGLLAFYKQHYIPNNATLVIVGDVAVDEAINLAQKAFESITPDPHYKKETYHYTSDIESKSIILRRDVQQPILMYAWVVPGVRTNQTFIADIASWVLGEGKGSRLYKKLVDELELATDMQVDLYDLFDQSVVFVHIDPIDVAAISKIEKIVKEEIATLQQYGITEHELQRALKQTHMEHLALFENNQKIAYEIGKLFLAKNDENALFAYYSDDVPLKDQVNQFFKDHMRLSRMHKGSVLSFQNDEQKDWLVLQELSDKEDERILLRKVRESTVECGVFVEQVVVNEAVAFKYPHVQKNQLSNGLIVLTHSNNAVPKIDLILDLKMRHFYDPEDKQGLINFMSEMLLEGTQNYTDSAFADAAESRGISITVQAGIISLSMLKEDFEYALELLAQILTGATFPEKNIEKVRQQILSEIAHYWDSPNEFAGQLIRSALYKNHPYHKNLFGDEKSVKKITRADLLNAYKKYISSFDARIALVGDLENINVLEILEEKLGSWQGEPVKDISYPPIESGKPQEINYPINRDQTVLCFAAPSIARLDNKYDSLLLFDQIFTGGVLGSMSSYLFKLREQTGLFYTIGGSVIAGADEQPGLVYIRTIVSNDRLKEATTLIQEAIENAKNIITQDDIVHARNALINSMVDNFESNDAMAQTFLFIDRFGLPVDYFDNRLKQLSAISVEEIKNNVAMVLDKNKLITVKIGRIES